MISEIHKRLREATQADHERLESRMDIMARVGAPDTRRALVAQFHRLHREVEAAVSPWLADLPGLDFESRRRSPLLERDLSALGTSVPATPQSTTIPAEGIGQSLGLMYVLEGSTLGGRMIRRHVEAQGQDMLGLSFLDPYGADAGERWRAFMAAVDRNVSGPTDGEAVVSGAQAGFRHAELCLCGEPLHV